MIELTHYEKAVLVSGDGDFYCLVEYLRGIHKLGVIIIPDHERYSALLKKINTPSEKYFVFLNQVRSKVEYTHIKKKPPM